MAVTPLARRLGLLAVGALAVRGIYLVELWSTPLFSVVFGDGKEYVAWARDIAAGHWLGTSVFYQAPLYPYALGALFTLAGPSLGAVRIAQALLGTASCVLLALAGRRFVGERGGLAAGWLLALYAPAIFFDGLVQKSSLDLFLVSALLAALGEAVASTRRRGRMFATAGLVLGLLALNRENLRVLYPVVAAWTWWFFSAEPRGCRARWIAAFTAAMLLVLVPVGIRNDVVGGEFLVSTSQLGPNLYIGNRTGASGTYEPLVPGHGNVAFEREDAARLAEQASGRTLSAGEVSAYWTTRAIADVRSAPGAWLRLMGRKVLLTIGAREIVDTESIEIYAEFSRVLAALSWFSFGGVLSLAVLGAWLTRRDWRTLALPCVIFLAIVASVAAFYVLARYRVPAVPVALVFAGAAIARLLDDVVALARHRRPMDRSAWPGVALAMATLVVAHLPLQAAGDDTLLNVGEELVRAGRTAEARPFLQRAAAASPDYAPARFNLGVALGRLGEPQRALEEFRAAVGLDPSDGDAQSALALALAESGDAAGALWHFREAARLRPKDPKARFNFANALQQSGQPRESIAEYRAAIALKPDYAEAFGNLALALAALDDWAGTIANLTEAARLQPESLAIQYNLARALNDTGRPGEAIAHYERAAALARAQGRLQEVAAIESDAAEARRRLKR